MNASSAAANWVPQIEENAEEEDDHELDLNEEDEEETDNFKPAPEDMPAAVVLKENVKQDKSSKDKEEAQTAAQKK